MLSLYGRQVTHCATEARRCRFHSLLWRLKHWCTQALMLTLQVLWPTTSWKVPAAQGSASSEAALGT